MDVTNMTIKAIKEGISRGNYEVTGVLETGEIAVAVLSDTEIDILNSIKNYEQLKSFKNTKGRPAEEILQVYKQKYSDKQNRCRKNNLSLR